MSALPPPPAPVVLLVEDSPDDRELTLTALQEVAERVDIACDGVEALDYLLGRGQRAGRPAPAPALILLDLKMPRVNGLQVLEAVRADPRLAATRIVILTSSDEERDRERCRKLGVTDYMRKETDFALFRRQVRALWPRWTGAAT